MADEEDNRHHFRISATVRGADADYDGQLAEVEIRAYSLNEALLAAAELPMTAWFPDLAVVGAVPPAIAEPLPRNGATPAPISTSTPSQERHQLTMTEPASFEEYTARYNANTCVEGYGADVVTVAACPWCAAPGFARWRITDTHQDMARETTCTECGRSGKVHFRVDEPGYTEAEMVQTGGPDAPAWLNPPPRRVDVAV